MSKFNKQEIEASKFVMDMTKRASDLAKFDGARRNPRATDETLEDMYKDSRTKGLSDEDKFAVMIGTYFIVGDNYEKYYVKAAAIAVAEGVL